jgi:hypothetical protein
MQPDILGGTSWPRSSTAGSWSVLPCAACAVELAKFEVTQLRKFGTSLVQIVARELDYTARAI